MTLVPKKDGTTKVLIEYHWVNAIMIKDKYPLPLVQDIFNQLGRSQVFHTLHMCSGYRQLPMEESSIEKTVFVCHCGQFEFVSPATIQAG